MEQWNQYGYDSGLTNHAPGNTGPKNNVDLTLKSQFQKNSSERPPIVRSSSVHSPAISSQYLYTGYQDGLVALNRSDGSERWRAQTNGRVWGTPALTNNKIICGTVRGFVNENGAFQHEGGSLYAFDSETGDKLWSKDFSDSIESSINIFDKNIYFCTKSNLYKFGINGEKLWVYETDGLVSGGVPAVNSNNVFFTVVNSGEDVENRDGSIYAVNTSSGSKKWEFRTDGPIRSHPAVSGSEVYVTTGNSVVYAVNAETGRETWSNTSIEGIQSHTSPSITDESLYIGSLPGSVHRLSRSDGAVQWSTELFQGQIPAPAIVDDVVYVSKYGAHIYAIDTEDGSELWRYKIKNSFTSTPAVADGTIYLGDDKQTVFVLGEENNNNNNNNNKKSNTNETKSPQLVDKNELSNGDVLATVTVEGKDYYVINQIANKADSTYAYTTDSYELLQPEIATNVAISYEFCDSYSLDSNQRLKQANEDISTWETRQDMVRIAGLAAQLSGVLALSTIGPESALSRMVDMATTGVDWLQRDMRKPHYQRYAQLAAAATTLDWIDDELGEASNSLLSVTDSGLEMIQLTLDSAGKIGTIGDINDIGKSIKPVVKNMLSGSDIVQTNIKPRQISSGGDLRKKGVTIIADFAVNQAVDEVVNTAEEWSKMCAIGRAGAAARIPILNQLIGYEIRTGKYNLGPAGMLRMQLLRQVDYQIDSIVKYEISRIWRRLAEGPVGNVRNEIYNLEAKAKMFESRAEVWENAMYLTVAATGRNIRQAMDRYRESLNYKQYGEQSQLDY